jgi:hypothetical protein
MPRRSRNIDDFDANAPHREAAMFYGLFLRGHSPDSLRKVIDVPQALLEKWTTSPAYKEQSFQQRIREMYEYRKRVLAIFEELIDNKRHKPSLQ